MRKNGFKVMMIILSLLFAVLICGKLREFAGSNYQCVTSGLSRMPQTQACGIEAYLNIAAWFGVYAVFLSVLSISYKKAKD